MKYRPEIDGLRFIAVFIVIIYHIRLNLLDTNIFAGGFVGVDIFFVISGYLITSLIIEDVQKNQFSVIDFFERRIRRIIPLLTFVSLFFLLVSMILLRGNNLLELSNTILSSIFFFSNYFFIFKEVQYGVDSNSINPFLHTWSLSIEEQYYILFPLLVLLLKKKLTFLKLSIITIFLISLYLCIYGFKNYPNINFFLFSSRIWEILLGSLIALIPNCKIKNKLTTNFFTIFGIILILYSSFYFSDIDENFPSIKNLIPTIGTAVFIYFSNGNNDLVSKFLSLKLFIFLGKISFSLYLIHMPVITLIRNTDLVSGTMINKSIAVIFIFIFSIFTYFFIEKRFRDRNLVSKKNLFRSIFIIYILLISLISFISFKNGEIFSIQEKYENILQTAKKNQIHEDLEKCIDRNIDQKNIEKNSLTCSFNPEQDQKIFLIGDSSIINLADTLIKEYPKYNYQVHITTGCLFLPEYNKRNLWNNNIDSLCNKNEFNKIKNILLRNNNSIFIFNHRIQLYIENSHFSPKSKWDYYYENNEIDKVIKPNDFIKSYQDFTINNNKILIIYPIPELNFQPYEKISNIYTLNRIKDFNTDEKILELAIEYSDFISRSKSSIDLYDSMLNENIIKVDPSEFICNDISLNHCKVMFDGGILYEDDYHLSQFGAKKLAVMIMHKLSNLKF